MSSAIENLTTELNQLLDELDSARGRYGAAPAKKEGLLHRAPRHPFRTNCTVRFILTGTTRVQATEGRTRNLSQGGLGLLMRRMCQRGEPIEVELTFPGKSPTCVGGVVAFCRYAGRGFHEVGLCLKLAQPRPILSRNLHEALATFRWLREAADRLSAASRR